MSGVDRARALAESDAFVHAPIAYSILDLDGRQVAANAAFHQLFRTDREMISVGAITHPDDLERTAVYLGALASGDQSQAVVDKRYLRSDGTTFWGRLTATALSGADGRPELLLGVIEDVTAQMDTLTQLTAASESKSEFVARVSHDLRTPLHAIGGLAELLSHADLGPQHRSYADAIRQESEALRVLVDDLLDLSRVEAGRVEINHTSFPLGSWVSSAVDLLRSRAEAKEIGLALTIADGLGHNVVGDADRLRQVLVNLVDNAVKFTSNGSVNIDVSAGDGDDVVFRIDDSGPGIDPTDLEIIFEPFAQAHGDQSGTGLGLTISRELAEVMGGSLTVTSLAGTGSTFTLRVPLLRSDADPLVAVMAAQSATEDQRRPVVLVVEDSPVNRLLVASQLEHLGCDHVLAADGTQALEALESAEFAAVLMDWHLPDMDGLETTRRLRALEANSSRPRVPVVAVTARAMSGDRQRCLAAGMDDFLPKPVGLDDLHRVLRHWVPDEAIGPIDGNLAVSQLDPFADVEAIERLVDELGDASIVATLVKTFLGELPARHAAIVNGAAAGDLEMVRRAAHTLKSTSAVLGAIGLARVATALEAQARADDHALDHLVADLDRLTQQATAGFASIIDRLEDQ